MGRRFQAARREHLAEPVTFDCVHVERKPVRDGDGKPVPGEFKEVEVTTTFTCRGQVSTLLLSEFADAADVDADTPQGMELLARFFKAAFGDEKEHRRFSRYAAEHLDDETTMAILAGLVEDFVGRPTTGRSLSPAQPSTTGPSTRDAGSPVVLGEVVTPPPSSTSSPQPSASS